MTTITTYLIFDGTARQAMTFYAQCLGGELHMMTVAQGPSEAPPEARDRILHARLTAGQGVIMASDCPLGMPLQVGNNFAISIGCQSQEEADRLFAALGEGGRVLMPLADMFWGDYFGMIVDRFGVAWMFNYTRPKAA